MTNKQLNRLVESYQKTPSEESFRKVYDVVMARWVKENAIQNIARRYSLDHDDVLGVALDKLMESIDKYKVGKSNFYNFLSVSVSRACIDLHRKNRRHYEVVSFEQEFGQESEKYSETSTLLDFLPHANAEEEIIETLQKKIDQRQLIDSLLDKAPFESRQALEAFVESDYSYTEAAKLLGTSYPTVKRRIEKIATYFDANQNGNIYDYFTSATA